MRVVAFALGGFCAVVASAAPPFSKSLVCLAYLSQSAESDRYGVPSNPKLTAALETFRKFRVETLQKSGASPSFSRVSSHRHAGREARVAARIKGVEWDLRVNRRPPSAFAVTLRGQEAIGDFYARLGEQLQRLGMLTISDIRFGYGMAMGALWSSVAAFGATSGLTSEPGLRLALECAATTIAMLVAAETGGSPLINADWRANDRADATQQFLETPPADADRGDWLFHSDTRRVDGLAARSLIESGPNRIGTFRQAVRDSHFFVSLLRDLRNRDSANNDTSWVHFDELLFRDVTSGEPRLVLVVRTSAEKPRPPARPRRTPNWSTPFGEAVGPWEHPGLVPVPVPVPVPVRD